MYATNEQVEQVLMRIHGWDRGAARCERLAIKANYEGDALTQAVETEAYNEFAHKAAAARDVMRLLGIVVSDDCVAQHAG